LFTRLVPGGAFSQIVPSDPRFVQSAPFLNRVVQAAPAVVPARSLAQVVEVMTPFMVSIIFTNSVLVLTQGGHNL